MSEKIIRDPVHDVIAFRLERNADALLFRLIGAAELQRLRRIRQLGMAHLAYPGADHSRYSHSIGVMETARRILDHLGKSHYIDEETRLVICCAALLHDLGHGPFSHVFERVSGLPHETLTQRVILDPESEVHEILSEYDRTLPMRVADLLADKSPRTFAGDLLASQLDADRLDYLLRDNHMTGSRYVYDLRWLLHALVIDEKSQRLAVSWKGVSAVESYLQARYHMYRNVYFHKVVRSAEGMVKLALQRAKRLAIQDRLSWPTREDNVHLALTGQRLTVEQFLDLDDVSVTHCFKLWSNGDDAPLAALCRGLLFRRVYKTIDLSRIDDAGVIAEKIEIATAAIEAAGGDETTDLFYDEITDTPYEAYQPNEAEPATEILVCDPDGRLVEFATISPITQALNRQLSYKRLHVAPQYRDAIRAALFHR